MVENNDSNVLMGEQDLSIAAGVSNETVSRSFALS